MLSKLLFVVILTILLLVVDPSIPVVGVPTGLNFKSIILAPIVDNPHGLTTPPLGVKSDLFCSIFEYKKVLKSVLFKPDW